MILNINCCENLEDEHKIIFYAAILHKNGAINDVKLRGIFKSLRERIAKKNTYWLVRTYHCNINDKWYNDMFMQDIFKDIIYYDMSTHISTTSLDIKELISYVNIYLNKSHNYCVDFIFFNYIKEAINRNRSYNGYYEYVNSYFNTNFTILRKEDDEFSSSGYCCEDCDGDYDDYVENRYIHFTLDRIKEEIEKHFKKEYISNLKNYKYLSYKDFSL